MTEYLARISEMTKNAMHGMFAAEKTGDRAKMDEAAKDYNALCEAVVAMEKQAAKLPMSRKCGKLVYYCSTCNHYIGDFDRLPREYCDFCGQRLRENDK